MYHIVKDYSPGNQDNALCGKMLVKGITRIPVRAYIGHSTEHVWVHELINKEPCCKGCEAAVSPLDYLAHTDL